jgi:hypothetical protein
MKLMGVNWHRVPDVRYSSHKAGLANPAGGPARSRQENRPRLQPRPGLKSVTKQLFNTPFNISNSQKLQGLMSGE